MSLRFLTLPFVLGALLAAGFAGTSANAQSAWDFQVSPGLWLAGLDGDLGMVFRPRKSRSRLRHVSFWQRPQRATVFLDGLVVQTTATVGMGEPIVGSACDGDVGNMADAATETYTKAIGAPSLETYWQDPEFDPALHAFYYVRVLEIPTPRWTAYDAAFFGVDLPDNVEPTHQERAYTSPIWYTT